MAKPSSKIEYLRRVNFLSQKEVANQLNMTQQYYGKLEKTPEKISLKTAIQLKQIFMVDYIDDLLGEVS